jgi:hypothetical protein
MSKQPPIPPDQRVHSGPGDQRSAHADLGSDAAHARDPNLREQGRAGNLAQNVAATHWKTQDR